MDQRVLSADATAQLRQGIGLLLSKWNTLQMTVDNEWGGYPRPLLREPLPPPPTRAIFVPDKECQKPELLATSSDFLCVWRISSDDDSHDSTDGLLTDALSSHTAITDDSVPTLTAHMFLRSFCSHSHSMPLDEPKIFLNLRIPHSWMSSFDLKKKLLPAKKAWKSFTITIQSKLYRVTKSLKEKSYRAIALRAVRFLIPHKLRGLSRRSPTCPSHQLHHYHQHHHQLQKSFPPIYVDELFPEAASMQVADDAKKAKETAASTSSSSTTLTDAWNNLSVHSKFRGVDERAEEFISKFREDMQLQREQSILEFQEMLARGERHKKESSSWDDDCIGHTAAVNERFEGLDVVNYYNLKKVVVIFEVSKIMYLWLANVH
ncbi:hypothetical protein RJ639_002343 [Escallonia herrerae]|uniref:Uncharacterized protein n=1 Tax=Escallonia herrerae TaxID=1293975 RepID=A0AA88X7F8_9ASTE|nr:hypothetical protein RJ639_002343 [Escallonia herrerae]